MKLGVLFSGGKDSCFAAYLAKKYGHELICLISILSENKDSFMFHTPSIKKTKVQAEAMDLPIILQKTKGEKEDELDDLEKAIEKAIDKYEISGIVTGAIASVYQAGRIQKICNKFGLEVFNPLWQKDELEYLNELIENNFKVIVSGVFAYPLEEHFLGREINKDFIKEVVKLNEQYKIHVAGEGGEFETFVLNCPLFNHELKIKSFQNIKEGENSWRQELEVL